jgi:1,4-dihydroxy-2-naphthoate octaprenyltransferase
MTVNPKMWVAALRIIPRIEKPEFDRLDPFARWLIATRGAVLVMTFLSATLGGLFAALAGQFNWGLYILVAVGLVVAHGASNLFNDYWDYKQGVDTDNYFRAQYGPHPLVAGLFTERQLLTWAIGTTLFPVAIGLYLAWVRGPLVLVFALLGGFVMMSYAGKPFPLKYLGLGEPAVFLTWGPLMVGGSYFCITGTLPWWVILASFPYALGTTGVLFGKHIDKIQDDTTKGIHTLPVRLGERRARAVSIGIFVLMYVLVLPLVFLGWLPWLVLLAFLSLPRARMAIKAFRAQKPSGPPEGYPKESWPLWFVGFAFLLNRDYGGLFMIGLFVAAVLQFLGVPFLFIHLA